MALIARLIPLHFCQTVFTSREWTDGFHKMVNLSQQLLHRTALMVAGYRVVKRLPQTLNVVHPRQVDRLIITLNFGLPFSQRCVSRLLWMM